MKTNSALIDKYNVPGPRYTSYPTVPFWEGEDFTTDTWGDLLRTELSMAPDLPVSLYVHLPYCESLCTFCGCNRRITRNHGVEQPYIDAVLTEFKLYRELMGIPVIIKEIHLGGGTPTFFSPASLERLVQGLLKGNRVAPDAVMGFEGHPGSTTREHLKKLYDLGFRRVSFGVQDYDPTVQKAINRVQSFEQVQQVTALAREIGYTSISHDLVFGLPLQTLTSIADTMEKTRQLKPDRIAFYSYAHVPWIKGNGQRGFEDSDLPSAADKRALYERGRDLLDQAGYAEIGMDHFALPHDSLYRALQNGTLHRNFMGYTTTTAKMLLGLGASAISDAWRGFAQNEKDVDVYLARVQDDWEIPVFRGHALTDEDAAVRSLILDIMCRFHAQLPGFLTSGEFGPVIHAELREMQADGLISLAGNQLTVTEAGRPFLRNICMVFDLRLRRSQRTEKMFSQTI